MAEHAHSTCTSTVEGGGSPDTPLGQAQAVSLALIEMVSKFGHLAVSPVQRRAVWTAVDALKSADHPAAVVIEVELAARGTARR